MTRLEAILNIPERPKRVNTLTHYADSLGIDCSQALDQGGELNEEKLVLLIHDAEKKRASSNKQSANFVLFVALVGGVLFLMISLFPKFLGNLHEKIKEDDYEVRHRKPAMLYDEDGKPLNVGKKPVYVEMVDGVYKDLDKNGKVSKFLYYKDGVIKRRDDVSE